jgi:hypothetical protein
MTKPIQYIVFNGPPGAGKSTMAIELCLDMKRILKSSAMKPKVVTDSFSAPLKHFFAAALSEPYAWADKDKPRAELSGYSLRESLINLAEGHIKERYGRDIFGKWLVHRSLKKPLQLPEYVIIDDGGFTEEIDALPNKFVIRTNRPDRTFTGDSRGWYHTPDWVIVNDGDMAALWQKLRMLSERLLGGKV